MIPGLRGGGGVEKQTEEGGGRIAENGPHVRVWITHKIYLPEPRYSFEGSGNLNAPSRRLWLPVITKSLKLCFH